MSSNGDFSTTFNSPLGFFDEISESEETSDNYYDDSDFKFDDVQPQTVIIPDTVVLNGVTYKVTAVEKKAFKKNKSIKSVTIGKNVKSLRMILLFHTLLPE